MNPINKKNRIRKTVLQTCFSIIDNVYFNHFCPITVKFLCTKVVDKKSTS